MLKKVSLGVGMGNASDAVKSAADRIIGTNDEDG
jgi:hydroxymethylpyrimidine pyrophosphatase-like HAD family hydrolase